MPQQLDDFRLTLNKKEYVPIIVGGMGVDISTIELALVAARLGGIGHISDAMVPSVMDRRYKTHFVKSKFKKYKDYVGNPDKTQVQFDLEELKQAARLHVEKAINAKQGSGGIFLNCMEKLSMNNPKETLKTRLYAAMDGGIDGITLSAGLHLNTFGLIKDHPRFHDTQLGIIISSIRALRPFLKRGQRVNRLPDYIVVEGPLAGGHLGFGLDWAEYELQTLTQEVTQFLKKNDLNIPVIAAGGVFTGSDAVEFLKSGVSGVQVATRFTVTEECGLPDKVKQEYFKANEEDVEVNNLSPTGYPMRMLKNSPGIGSGIRPNCEAFGYILDRNGHCAYLEAYNREAAKGSRPLSIQDVTCLCSHFRKFNIWTCGHYVYRLKDTTTKTTDGAYQLLSAEHVFKDYQFSSDHQIQLPE